ncbi:hypothetical protein GQ53DRAFT_830371 [Thozetella sp. PMI_491]|nr:hypothetical protein GQ53DRAFT_830371 [Thozetella sp. PMI_491]
MHFTQLLRALGVSLVLKFAESTPSFAVPHSTKYPGGSSKEEIFSAFSRALRPVTLQSRQNTFNSNVTTLDSAWNNAVLYQHTFAGKDTAAEGDDTVPTTIQITCTTCYIKGSAQAIFTVAGGADNSTAGNSTAGGFPSLLLNFAKGVEGEIVNITEEAFQTVGGAIAKDALAFLNLTSSFAGKIANLTETALDKFIDAVENDIPGIKLLGPILDNLEDAAKEVFGNITAGFQKEVLALQQTTTNLKDKVANLTDAALVEVKNTIEGIDLIKSFDDILNDIEDAVEKVFGGLKNEFESGIDDIEAGFHFNSLALPTVDLDFNLPLLPEVPAVSLEFQLDGIELYMELDTMLSAGATYTLPLFISETPLGVSIGDSVTAGVVVSVDLILDVQAQIDISTGFHLKLDDRVSLELAMFGQNITNIQFPGAKFEFLPVLVAGTGAVIRGVLRIEVKAGLELSTPSVEVMDKQLSFGAGVVVSTFANLAEFVTNITGPASTSTNSTAQTSGNTSTCALEAIQYFEFNVGAVAGATLALGTHTWGPTPNKTVPVFYTTIGDACVDQRPPSTTTATGVALTSSATLTASATLAARVASSDEPILTATTITSTAIFTGQTCMSSGLINCPASLQSTTTFSTVLTFVTAVAAGVTPTFPATSVASVASSIPFGSKVLSAVATTGSLTSYIPPTTTQSSIPGSSSAPSGITDGETAGGVSKKLILGVSLGVGLPVLLGLIAAAVYLWRKERDAVSYTAMSKGVGPPRLARSYSSDSNVTPPENGTLVSKVLSVLQAEKRGRAG